MEVSGYRVHAEVLRADNLLTGPMFLIPGSSKPCPVPNPRADGPAFPGFVITWYITKTPIPDEWRVEITRYLANFQRKGGESDQGWGMYASAPPELHSTPADNRRAATSKASRRSSAPRSTTSRVVYSAWAPTSP